MSSISTKRGDSGKTYTYSGEQVSKSDSIPRALGALDEVVSVLGIVRSQSEDLVLKELLLDIQRACFVLGSEMATHPDKCDRLQVRVDESFMSLWETRRDELEARVEMPKDFILPGEDPLAAYLDLARCVMRRCEREAVQLVDEGHLQNPLVLAWLNRMSDFLWLLGRDIEGENMKRVSDRPLPSSDASA